LMLLNGNMTVAAGTSIVITDTLTWQFSPGTSLVNDGLIDLGHGTTLEELDGEPVTGSGTERSLTDLNAAGSGVEPGGLGLTLDLPQADEMLTITRGHLPRVAGNGVEGVARWYFLEASALAGDFIPISMQIDGSELNGLPSDQLALHVSGSTEGPWEQVSTTIGPSNTLEGVLSGASLHLTAFDPDLITAAAAGTASPGYRVWPTVVQDVVHVESLGSGSLLIELEVLDATGRSVLRHTPAAGSSSATLGFHGLAPGGYLIRVNKNATYRVVRP
ncbi:MAG TPA: hypothetical protein PLN54_06195, partial [Flavobacteriales bacterium]|nr:hypothetical protein [Flavobacteriales bacterium]